MILLYKCAKQNCNLFLCDLLPDRICYIKRSRIRKTATKPLQSCILRLRRSATRFLRPSASKSRLRSARRCGSAPTPLRRSARRCRGRSAARRRRRSANKCHGKSAGMFPRSIVSRSGVYKVYQVSWAGEEYKVDESELISWLLGRSIQYLKILLLGPA